MSSADSTPRCGEPRTSITSCARQNLSMAPATKPCGEAFALIMGDGGGRGWRTLAADRLGAAALHVVHDDRDVAAGAIQMRLDHLEREGGGDAGVEGVAAFFKDGHADGGRDPVRGRND